MAETAQDASATPQPTPLPSRRIRVRALFILICSVVLGLTYGGIHFLLRAVRPHAFLDDRLYDTAIALAFLIFPARIFWVMLGTRLSTGRWTKTPEQRRQNMAQWAAKRAATPRTVTRPSGWSLMIYWLKWANYNAREPQTPPGRRLAARALLLLGLLGYVAACLFPLVCVGAAFADDNTHTATVFFLVMAAFFVLIPWSLTRSLLRYRSKHPFMRTQPEELGELGAQHTQWWMQESQKPLRAKLIASLAAFALPGFWWLRLTVFHGHHPHDSWVTPLMYTPFALYAVIMQFRKPGPSRQSPPQEAQPN